MDEMNEVKEYLNRGIRLNVGSFDCDKEIEFWIEGESVYLTPNEVNDLVTHLVKCLKYIKEPIDYIEQTSNEN